MSRLFRARKFHRRIRDFNSGDVARSVGASSLSEFWRLIRADGFLYSEAEREQLRALYLRHYPQELASLRDTVDRILTHEFDLLGSGPIRLGPRMDWHTDFKTGRKWDLSPSGGIDYAEIDQPSDVKIPWELSRCQHLVTLGQAWVLFGDERLVSEFEQQVRSWVSANPVGHGVNWACTMEVALRVVNWIWALALFADAPMSHDFVELILLSIYRHGLWIPEHLEFSNVNGNHYLSDALGLVACGTLFRKSSEGQFWLNKGSDILEEEIQLQVDSDGVDIEGSVPYHRLVLEIFLVGARLMRTAGRLPSSRYDAKVEQMVAFVHAYVGPDGSCPVIGDADNGRAFSFGQTPINDHRYLLAIGSVLFGQMKWRTAAGKCWEDTIWLLGPDAYFEMSPESGEREERSIAFPESGNFVLRSPLQYLFVDAGPVGFRGLGGHGHNDCLSFEWHAAGRSLLTDSGLYVYTASAEWRDRFRSTAFHNTIRVDGEEMNRFLTPPTLWFLGNDAIPTGVQFEAGEEADILSAGHTGYRRLAQPVTVHRRFKLFRRKPGLQLVDRLEGEGEHLVEIFFHSAPGALYDPVGENQAGFRWPDGIQLTIRRTAGPAVRMEVIEGWFAPSYGVKIARPVCIASLHTRLPFELVWDLAVEVPDDSRQTVRV